MTRRIGALAGPDIDGIDTLIGVDHDAVVIGHSVFLPDRIRPAWRWTPVQARELAAWLELAAAEAEKQTMTGDPR